MKYKLMNSDHNIALTGFTECICVEVLSSIMKLHIHCF